jgi:hypothetical protein
MAHAQKPDFVFRRNGRVHLNRRGASVQSATGSRGVRISGSTAGYTMFRGSVKGTGYLLHSPVSPSLSLPCVTVCHHISTGLYKVETLRSTSRQKNNITRGTVSSQDLYTITNQTQLDTVNTYIVNIHNTRQERTDTIVL